MIEGDWIDSFLRFTDGRSSSRIFRLWAGITAVAASLERRVWVRSKREHVYPTLYTLLVGKPGTGKSQAIRPVSALWYATKELHVASNSVTKASLTDELEAAKRTLVIQSENRIIEYHSLQIAASEFGVLVPAHDLDFLNFLNQIYDNDPNYRESRRTGNRKVDTVNPQINILAGTQPAYLATLLPEEAWGMGFMTRMIMVYSSEVFRDDLFNSNDVTDAEQFAELTLGLKSLLKAHGEVQWENEARDEIQTWYSNGCPPEPEHSRLVSYNTRRILHVLRLCIISAASAGHPMLITFVDFNRASNWLIEAEQTMPDIFKEMVQRSDTQVIEELYLFVLQQWAKNKQWVHENRLWFHLKSKVSSDKIARIIEVAVRSNILDKQADQPLYRPRTRSEHGTE